MKYEDRMSDPIFAERPEYPYHRDDEAWHRYVFFLSSTYGTQRKDTAALCGVKLATMDNHETTINVWAQGQAVFNNANWADMLNIARDLPGNYEDPIERAQVRSLAADMNKHISKIVEKRNELTMVQGEGDKNRETLSKLTDAELRAKAEQLLKGKK
jgi:hypothetical protein